MARYIQPTFSGGELSPQLYGRVDLAWYFNSVSLMSNMYALKFGGARKRPGLQFIAPTKDNGAVRLIPFSAGTNLSYLVEFGHLYARFYFGQGPIESGTGPGLNEVFEIATPFPVDELYNFRFVQSKDVMYITHDRIGIFKLVRLTSTTFEFVEYEPKWGPFKSENIEPYYLQVSAQDGPISIKSTAYANNFVPWTWDGSTNPELSFGGGFVADTYNMYCDDPRFARITPGDIFNISGTSSNDGTYTCTAVITTNPSFDYIIVVSEPDQFAAETLTTGTVAFSGEAVDPAQDIFKPEDVGAYIRLRELTETEHDKWEPDRRDTVTGDPLDYETGQYATYADNVYENMSPTGISGRRPPTHEHGTKPDGQFPLDFLNWQYRHANQGYAKIIEYVSPTEVYAQVITTIPSSYLEANYLWSFSYWGPGDDTGDHYGYPTAVGFHQGRLWFGGSPTFPQTIWGSVSDDYENFKVEFPVQDDDGITHFIDSRSLSNIEHLEQLSDMISFTNGAEWKVMPQGDSVLTPASVGAYSQSFIGSSTLPPLIIDNDSLFLDTSQRRLYSFGYLMNADRYQGDELSIKADHLFAGYTIKDWCYAREPNDIVWLVRNDGVLLAMTYMPTQDVFAWHQHHTNGEVESIAAVSYLGYDVVYVVVKRIIEGEEKRYIEFLKSDVFSTISDGFYVDSGLTYNGGPDDKKGIAEFEPSNLPNSSLLTSSVDEVIFSTTDLGRIFVSENGIEHTITEVISQYQVSVIPSEAHDGGTWQVLGVQATEFSGLEHLEGQSVVALGDGSVFDDLTVVGGQVVIDVPKLVVHIGLGYESHLETLDLEVQSSTGSNQGKKNNVKDCLLRLVNSRDVQVGPNSEQLRPLKARSDEIYEDAPDIKNGDYIITSYPQWKDGARLHIANKTPTPLEISLIGPRIEIGGS